MHSYSILSQLLLLMLKLIAHCVIGTISSVATKRRKDSNPRMRRKTKQTKDKAGLQDDKTAAVPPPILCLAHCNTINTQRTLHVRQVKNRSIFFVQLYGKLTVDCHHVIPAISCAGADSFDYED